MIDNFVCNQCILKESQIESMRHHINMLKEEYRKLQSKFQVTVESKLETLNDRSRYPASGYD
jgi:hypothetical protein